MIEGRPFEGRSPHESSCLECKRGRMGTLRVVMTTWTSGLLIPSPPQLQFNPPEYIHMYVFSPCRRSQAKRLISRWSSMTMWACMHRREAKSIATHLISIGNKISSSKITVLSDTMVFSVIDRFDNNDRVSFRYYFF